jgi:two-component system response regulator YesN
VRIVIADDEEMARFMIRSLLEERRSAEPIEVVTEAGDGVELIEAVERRRPDLALVDIRMPQMGGLEAIRIGRERFPEVLWVILTSYAEFEYAREAIRLGALGYLLKPTRPEDLEELLSKAEAEVERRWRERNASTLSAIAIAHFLSGDRVFLSRSPHGRKWRGFIFALDGPEGTDYGAEEARIKADIEGRCRRRGWGQVLLPTKSRNFLVAVDGDDLPRPAALTASPGRPAITALCFESLEFSELCARLSEWDKALGLRLIQGIGREYSVSELESLPEPVLDCAESCSAFAAALGAADYAEAIDAIDQLGRAMNRQGGPASSAVLTEYAALIAGAPATGIEDPIGELKRVCESRIRASSEAPDIVAEVVAFVDRNYMENLGISAIAERLDISANYLSTIFHRRTGQKLVSYITEQRMLHAKRLLLENPSMPVSKVAALVGHSDSRYFAQQFLRHTGCYPSQYRNMSK